MSKNIAIISTYDWIKKANNYGSLFQYYALQEYLKQLGYNPYWVKYFPNHNNKNKNLYKTLISIVKRFLNKTLYYVHNNKVNICTKSFNKFILDYLNTSQYEYESWESLKAQPPIADFYVTGSDQVWKGLNRANYLEFVGEPAKKIAYAASFGEKNNLIYQHKDLIYSRLKKFSRISLREQQGINYCKEIGIKDILHVVDPVLLLSKEIYENLSEVSEFKPSSNSYVYIYALGINSKSQIQWNIIKQFARERSLNIKITPIQGGEHLFNNIFKVFPSPKAWLQLIKNADYVITNSFHGTLFSIIMEKHFIVIPKNKKDNRFSSLLSKLALNDRILETGSIQELKSIFDTNINWEEVNKRKNLFIEKSKEFIRSWENL